MSEGFEDALVTVHKYRLLSGKMCDRLQRAHDHELEQTRKAEYHRGYEDGQRSMDAEHRAVCHKLKRVMLDGDSHAMLSRLAYAIYPCATGWTGESCEGLRERVIELLGGVHDGVSNYVPGRACGDDRDNRDGQSQSEVKGPRGEPGQPGAPDITDELRSFVKNRMTEYVVHTTLPGSEPETQLTEEGYKFIAIADRIDERFDKATTSLCNEAACQKMRAMQLEGERDELRKSLRKIAEHAGVPHDLELSTYDDDTVAKATVQLVGMLHKHIKTLEAKLDAIREMLDE